MSSNLQSSICNREKKTAGHKDRRGWLSTTHGAVEEALELATAYRMLQLADRLGLDLADAFPSDFENAAHFLQRVGVAVAQAVTELDDLALAVGQSLED